MKQCSKCKEVKPLTDFHKNRRTKDGLQDRCRPCHIAGVTASIRRNKPRHAIQVKKWKVNHPEAAKTIQLRAEEARRRRGDYDRAVKRDSRPTKAETAARDKVRQAERLRRWKIAHPKRAAEFNRRGAMRRYAVKKEAAGYATTEQIRQRWAYYGDRCWMCGDPATQTDHVIPLNRGGSDWPSNQRPACGRCNRAKGDKLIA